MSKLSNKESKLLRSIEFFIKTLNTLSDKGKFEFRYTKLPKDSEGTFYKVLFGVVFLDNTTNKTANRFIKETSNISHNNIINFIQDSYKEFIKFLLYAKTNSYIKDHNDNILKIISTKDLLENGVI